MSALFPYANIAAGVLLLIIGFFIHWLAQLISVMNRDFATRLGLQEKGLLPGHRIYEHAIVVADAAMGWLQGAAALGLLLDFQSGYSLAWIPGSIFLHHAISA